MEDMLRACVLEHEGNWKKQLPLVEFAYNNNFQVTFRRRPMRLCMEESAYPHYIATKSGKKSEWTESFVRDKGPSPNDQRKRMKTTQSQQKSYVDNRRKNLGFEVRDWVYVKVFLMREVT